MRERKAHDSYRARFNRLSEALNQYIFTGRFMEKPYIQGLKNRLDEISASSDSAQEQLKQALIITLQCLQHTSQKGAVRLFGFSFNKSEVREAVIEKVCKGALGLSQSQSTEFAFDLESMTSYKIAELEDVQQARNNAPVAHIYEALDRPIGQQLTDRDLVGQERQIRSEAEDKLTRHTTDYPKKHFTELLTKAIDGIIAEQQQDNQIVASFEMK